MIFNLLIDPGSHALTVWELPHWLTNKATVLLKTIRLKSNYAVIKLSVFFKQQQ